MNSLQKVTDTTKKRFMQVTRDLAEVLQIVTHSDHLHVPELGGYNPDTTSICTNS